jgi:hypothetical protein
VVVPADELAARVVAHARSVSSAWAVDVDHQARVRIVGGMDEIAEAVGMVLGTVGPTREVVPIVQVETRARELRITGTPDGQGPAVRSMTEDTL